MHLIELIAALESVKIARGNVLLVDVLVVASGDREAIADFSNRRRPDPPKEQIVIDVTGMHEDQIDELRAENPGAKLVRRVAEPKEPEPELEAGKLSPEELAAQAKDAEAAGNVIRMPGTVTIDKVTTDPQPESVTIGPVTTSDPSSGTTDPPPPANLAGLQATMETAAANLDRKPNPCEEWDGQGHQCMLAAGHESDHLFNAAKEARSEPGDAGLPVEVVEKPAEE